MCLQLNQPPLVKTELPTPLSSMSHVPLPQVKCRGATATGPAFPCSRCIRLKLPCEDPQKAPISDPNSRLTDLTRSLLKRLESNTPVDRERLERLMCVHGTVRPLASRPSLSLSRSVSYLCRGLFALVYRRKVKTGAIKPDGVAVSGRKHGSVSAQRLLVVIPVYVRSCMSRPKAWWW